MKKFLYLRVNSIVGILIFVVFLCAVLFDTSNPQTSFLVDTLPYLLVFGIPSLHNVLILFIYHKYYPGKAIPKLYSSLNLVFNILCIIDLLLFVFLFDTISQGYVEAEWDKTLYFVFALTIAESITTLIQIIGSFRLIKIVKENARLQLENSFV